MKHIKSFKKLNENSKISNIEYIVDVTIDDLFSVCLNGMEYGIVTRKTIGNNDGIFDEEYVKCIVEAIMDDKDIYNEIGGSGFDNVLDDIPGLCKEYLKYINLIYTSNLEGNEISFCREEYPDVYQNILDSLEKIIKKL